MKPKTLFELFTWPEKWCKGRLARNDEGQHTPVDGFGACSWCLAGGVMTVYRGGAQYMSAMNALGAAINSLYPDRLIAMEYGHSPVVVFNDHPDTTFEDVIKVIKQANLPVLP